MSLPTLDAVTATHYGARHDSDRPEEDDQQSDHA